MNQEFSSGTVSKILWHFTGGPKWDTDNNRQLKNRKKFDEAYEILKAIIKSQQLRLSEYQEIVKVEVPQFSRSRDGVLSIRENPIEERVEASPVCCLADIPIQHLSYHAERYGKFAIGFYRKSAIKNNFNPVFYSLASTKVVNSIYNGLSASKQMDYDDLRFLLSNYFESFHGIESNNLSSLAGDVDNELDKLLELKKIINKSIKDFIAFVKTFSDDEFGTIYCEREWRSVETFNFSNRDIAMIVLPKRNGYYNKLVKENLVPGIPIVPWEDLIES